MLNKREKYLKDKLQIETIKKMLNENIDISLISKITKKI